MLTAETPKTRCLERQLPPCNLEEHVEVSRRASSVNVDPRSPSLPRVGRTLARISLPKHHISLTVDTHTHVIYLN